MSDGLSLFAIAIGAILKYAVNVTLYGIDIHTVGLILMIVGAVGLLLSLLWMTVWANRAGRPGTYGDPRVPPTEPYARTGEFTPPGMLFFARPKSWSLVVVVVTRGPSRSWRCRRRRPRLPRSGGRPPR